MTIPNMMPDLPTVSYRCRCGEIVRLIIQDPGVGDVAKLGIPVSVPCPRCRKHPAILFRADIDRDAFGPRAIWVGEDEPMKGYGIRARVGSTASDGTFDVTDEDAAVLRGLGVAIDDDDEVPS